MVLLATVSVLLSSLPIDEAKKFSEEEITQGISSKKK